MSDMSASGTETVLSPHRTSRRSPVSDAIAGSSNNRAGPLERQKEDQLAASIVQAEARNETKLCIVVFNLAMEFVTKSERAAHKYIAQVEFTT